MQLLDLPPDLLLLVASRLPFEERLRLSEVSRKLRDACGLPSPLWRAVDARVRYKGGVQQFEVDDAIDRPEEVLDPVWQQIQAFVR